MSEDSAPPIWGVSAEFASSGAMLAALQSLQERGFDRLDAFSPVPIEAAHTALRLPRDHFGWIAAAAALLGGAFLFGLCVYATIFSYRFNIGGRPLFSWPYYVVPTCSFAMLCGAVAVFGAFLVLNRMPRLNHPAFNIPDFFEVTEDRFFVAVEGRDQFDPEAVEDALANLPDPPLRISRVPR